MTLDQEFKTINVRARVVNTDHFQLAVSSKAEHGHVKKHIKAEAEADMTRKDLSGNISIVYGEAGGSIVRAGVPQRMEAELSKHVGGVIDAEVRTCNFGSKDLISFNLL